MKTNKLKITPRFNASGSKSFCVDAGRINGKRHRKFFLNQKEARIYARTISKAKANRGELAFSLNSRQQIEAVEAFKRLDGASATLTQAIDFFLKHARPKGGIKLVSEVVTELLREKKNNEAKPRYLKELKYKFKNFTASFGEAKINELSRNQVAEWLDAKTFSSLTKKNYLRDLGILFKHALDQNYIAENIITKIKKPTPKETPVEIYTVSQAEILLFAAQSSPDLKQLVPYLAIGLFAGLRSCEIELLDWNEINLRLRTIEVKPENSKTSRRRIVRISENLVEWLKPYEEMKGQVVCKSWRKKLPELMKRAEFKKLPNNGLRHSFASYHFAHHKNANETAAELGHESTKMLFRHYRELVQPQDAELFWKILPTKGYAMVPVTEKQNEEDGRNLKRIKLKFTKSLKKLQPQATSLN